MFPHSDRLDSQFETAAPGAQIGGVRKDPRFNRLTADIHAAVKQFNALNRNREHPNVLVLVNHHERCWFLDLLGVLTGHFYAEDGTAHAIYRQFSEGRIKADKARIDLYLWLDDYKPERLLFSQQHPLHHRSVCAAFGIKPADIHQISP